ncbi:hypothetical protein LIER_27812 [Lithospermum erythrorhizon]|uniref:Uncharacterized protein n=1 Tax=Lithospermum erythrorhizon TaxID=34254 RepID=A0AAV3RDD3_LITER
MELSIAANKGDFPSVSAASYPKVKYEPKKPKEACKLEKKKHMLWADYSDNEDYEACHVCVEVDDNSTTTEALRVTTPASSSLQTFAITFTDGDLPQEDGTHNKPLYVSGYVNEIRINRMLVDRGSAVNILPLQALKLIDISTEDLQQSRIIIQGFNQDGERMLGKLGLHLVLGELETTAWFHVIDAKVTYNILLGRSWIHSSNVVPSTLH